MLRRRYFLRAALPLPVRRGGCAAAAAFLPAFLAARLALMRSPRAFLAAADIPLGPDLLGEGLRRCEISETASWPPAFSALRLAQYAFIRLPTALR